MFFLFFFRYLLSLTVKSLVFFFCAISFVPFGRQAQRETAAQGGTALDPSHQLLLVFVWTFDNFGFSIPICSLYHLLQLSSLHLLIYFYLLSFSFLFAHCYRITVYSNDRVYQIYDAFIYSDSCLCNLHLSFPTNQASPNMVVLCCAQPQYCTLEYVEVKRKTLLPDFRMWSNVEYSRLTRFSRVARLSPALYTGQQAILLLHSTTVNLIHTTPGDSTPLPTYLTYPDPLSLTSPLPPGSSSRRLPLSGQFNFTPNLSPSAYFRNKTPSPPQRPIPRKRRNAQS